MANYNKSFNFRNGVQVDNDNFIVNANGLVGIGTSIPTEFLDVYGTAKITGLVTTTNLYVSGISTFYNDVKVGSAITLSPSTGAVSATIFYGSAVGLTSIYAIAVDGWYISSGVSTTSKVGIGTTNSQYSLQVGQNPSTGNGFSVDAITGNVNATGITTAYSFSGFGTNIQGINASNISNGTLDNARLPQNINVSGITTAYSFRGFGTNIQGINASNISNGTLNNSRLPQNISITGIITASSGIITSLTTTNINNTGIATLGIATASQIYVSGVTTSFGGFVGNLTGNVTGNVTGTATTASNLTGTPNIIVANVTSSNINNTGIITSGNIISGISSVGVSTVYTRLYAESIGVGTNSPASNIHVRRTSTSTLQLTSDSAEAIVALGRSTTLAGSNGALRYGNTSGLQRYSNGTSLDIINYSTGNINSYLQLGSTGINTGSFNWFYGQIVPNSPLMTLTYGGSLGIGVTLPTNTLHVVGTSTVTNNAYVGSNLYVASNLYVSGTLNLPSGSINANLTGNVTGTLTGNVYASSGISTFNNLKVTGVSTTTTLFATSIGINTTTNRIDLDILAGTGIFVAIGVGTNIVLSSADFSNSGNNYDITKAFMIPPKVSSADRVGLTTVEGGMIYNTTVRRLELYLGNDRGWVGIATVV